MEIIINRIRKKELTTDGILSIDRLHICETAEATPTMLPSGKYRISIFKCPKDKRNIPIVLFGDNTHDTCSPFSDKCKCCTDTAEAHLKIRMQEYETLERCRFKEEQHEEIHRFESEVVKASRLRHIEIEASIGNKCYCPRILPGNGVYNRTDGAILIGRYLAPGILTQSREYFDRLHDRIEKTLARGKEVWLVIK